MARRAATVEELSKDDQHFLDALNNENPLPCVLLAVSTFEQALAAVLRGFMIEDKRSNELLDVEGNGALSTLGACNKTAYCLGLIPKHLFENLRWFARLRNIFAHSHVPLDFENPEVVEACKHIEPRVAHPIPESTHLKLDVPKVRFVLAAVAVRSHLLSIAREVKRRDRV